jgi:hypothetical protein
MGKDQPSGSGRHLRGSCCKKRNNLKGRQYAKNAYCFFGQTHHPQLNGRRRRMSRRGFTESAIVDQEISDAHEAASKQFRNIAISPPILS